MVHPFSFFIAFISALCFSWRVRWLGFSCCSFYSLLGSLCVFYGLVACLLSLLFSVVAVFGGFCLDKPTSIRLALLYCLNSLVLLLRFWILINQLGINVKYSAKNLTLWAPFSSPTLLSFSNIQFSREFGEHKMCFSIVCWITGFLFTKTVFCISFGAICSKMQC